jgi:hypothetical protein
MPKRTSGRTITPSSSRRWSKSGSDAGEHEVRVGRPHLDTERPQLARQVLGTLGIHLARPPRVLLVVHRRERGDLGEPVHVERMARALQVARELRASDAVADPQPGQAEDLREGAQHHRRRTPREPADGVGEVRRGARTRSRPRRRRAPRRRAARRRTHRRPRPRRSSRSGCSGLQSIITRVRGPTAARMASRSWTKPSSRGTATGVAPMPLHHDRVHGERGPGVDDLVAGLEEGLRDQLEQLVRTAPEDQLVASDPQPLRQPGAQREAGAVGVAMHAAERIAQRGHRLRRGAEGALVRGQLDRALDAELALELLERLARLVRSERADVRLHQVGQRH